MKKTFKFVVSATMEWPESEMTEQRAHDYILSAIRESALNKLIDDGICDCDAEIERIDVEDAGTEEPTTDRALAMRQMEQELIEIVKEKGCEYVLLLDDLDMSWTEECDGEWYTNHIDAIEVRGTWDEDDFVVVNYGGDLIPFSDCDRDDLGHNLADYIYSEIKANY